jgi:hypothetical protein
MLEEKNDNLQEADGNLTTDSIEFQTTQQLQKRRQLLKLQHQKQLLLNWIIPLFSTEEELPTTAEVVENQNNKALSSIDDSNAEEGEDETLKERHEIPMQDYDTYH